jgi:hypothetical protein
MAEHHAKLLQDVDDLMLVLDQRRLQGTAKNTIAHHQQINEKACLVFAEMQQMSIAAQHIVIKNEEKVFVLIRFIYLFIFVFIFILIFLYLLTFAFLYFFDLGFTSRGAC